MDFKKKQSLFIEARSKIDSIDKEIVIKINQRIKLAEKIGAIKKANQLPVYDPIREKEVYQKLVSFNEEKSGELSEEGIKAIFNEIIAYCRNKEEGDKSFFIGFLGPEGSYSHAATISQFGTNYLKGYRSIGDIFWALKEGYITLGVVPFENSIEGIVNNTLDLLAQNSFKIYSQFYMPISLNLLSRESEFKKINVLYSHPQPLAQAREWIEKNLTEATLKDTNSTSEAAYIAAREANSACIGSLTLVNLYPELKVLEENIQDKKNNTTRFLVISSKKQVINENIPCFTSLIIFIKDKKGALYDILSILASYNINLNNIVSRPSKKENFDYYFFIEFLGNENSSQVKNSLKKIKPMVLDLRVLGSYSLGNKG